MLTESAGLLKVDSFLSVIIKGLFWLFLIEDVIHVFGTGFVSKLYVAHK